MAKKSYSGLRGTLSDILVNHKTRAYHIANDVLGTLTILSIISVVLETVPSLNTYNFYFKTVEWTALAFFTAEYAARLYITKPARSYKGRALMTHDVDMIHQVNIKMDELRKRIRDLIDGMDKDEAKQLLAFRGEDLKQQFYV